MVAALALPNEEVNRQIQVGQIIPKRTVGWTRTDSKGAYRLEIDPALVPNGFRSPAGIVNLEVIAWGDGYQGEWGVPASLNGDDVEAGIGVVRHLQIAAKEKVHSRVGRTLPRAAKDAGVEASAACYEYLASTFNAWDVIGETWPYGAHTAKLVIEETHSHVLGIGISISGAAGTFTASGTQSITTSVEDDFGYSAAFRDYRMETRYGKYNGPCSGTRAKPILTTGGFMNTGLTGFPTSWSNCASAVGTWTRSATNGFKYQATVKTAGTLGINLESSTNYATTRKMSYSHPAAYHVCGNDNSPSLASKVRSGS
jgi:hypothetical protein